jgi:hypothetical protein
MEIEGPWEPQKKIIPRSKDEDYIVQFAFGILRFSEKQIELAKRKGA